MKPLPRHGGDLVYAPQRRKIPESEWLGTIILHDRTLVAGCALSLQSSLPPCDIDTLNTSS